MKIQFQDGFILLVEFITYSLFYILQHLIKELADEYRDDCRGRFVCTKAVVVTGRSDRSTKDICIIMHRLNRVNEEGEEHQVGLRRLARSEEVDPGISSHTPVVVLA